VDFALAYGADVLHPSKTNIAVKKSSTMKRLVLLFTLACLAMLFVCLSFSARAETTYTYNMKTGLAPWISWMTVEKTKDGVRMTLPGRLDPNHLDGIGPLWLLAHLPLNAADGPGFLDFDQAEVTIRFRAQNLDLKGARILWWIVRRLPAAETAPGYPWQETNWALTCCDLSKNLSGEWATVTVKLDADPSRWTYAGTNVMQFGDWGKRYVEYPLAKALTAKLLGTLHLAVVGTNASRAPTGTIEISSISLRTKAPGRRLSIADMEPFMHEGSWTAVRWHLKQLMPTDDATANYLYGRALALGLGGPQDCSGAAPYLQKALALSAARYELAKLYLYGLGVPRDRAKAVEILQADPSNPEASELLGLAYAFGIGVAPDNEKAVSLFRYAAERGQLHAMHELAQRLKDEHPAEAYYWYKLARKSLTKEIIGAQVDMLDVNIQELRATLPAAVVDAENQKVEQFVPAK
jgi:hypothetical protein